MSSMASSHFLHLTTFHQSSRHSLPFLNNHHHRTILTTTTTTTTTKIIYNFEIRASNGVGDNNNGDSLSYLKMWRQAVDRERKEDEFRRISQNLSHNNGDEGSSEGLEKKSSEFQKILQVSKEERDRAQRLQVIDRASAAIAAARALLRDKKDAAFAKASSKVESDNIGRLSFETNNGGTDSRNLYNRQARVSGDEPPGPNFWSWTPPPEVSSGQTDVDNIEKVPKTSGDSYPTIDVMIKERSADSLSLPLESTYSESKLVPPLPPFQSLMEVHNVEASDVNQEASVVNEELSSQFSAHALEAAHALHNIEGKPSHGVNPDGSRWWKETGVERRPDGVVCRWTLNRGVSANGVVEWEEKYWEAADEFDFKELGSEKSGRDAFGNVWHESWKESMWQEDGLLHMEKTADKWGKNAINEEWQEQWLEHYDASGKADKWAHKWCSIDPNTQVDVGHAHVWHERWGEKYDGQGGSIKYTDKWAERSEGDGWVKWGDKWDENFDLNGHGVKQGETWWEGKYGDRWNRTWGEHHNGSGWLHKYGKSSCGEHWDTHVQEDTWYERYPHFGFMHCFENSVQLREVQKPSEKL